MDRSTRWIVGILAVLGIVGDGGVRAWRRGARQP